MNKMKSIGMLITYLTIAAVLQGCSGMQLAPKFADTAEINGTYKLILFGCNYADDIQNMAILIDEKSQYLVDIYALDEMYKVKKDLSASQALSEAKTFISCSTHTVWQTVLRRIADKDGKTIAYELKPLYRSWEFGIPEVLLSSYSLKNGKVTAYIRLEPSVWLNVYGGGGGDFSGSAQ